MPYYLYALPVSSTGIKIKRSGETYPVLLDTDTFDRTGEDGDIPILPLSGGDEYVGECVEGHWHKGWDSDIAPPATTISGGTLRMVGTALVAGTGGNSWINSHIAAPLLDDLEYTFSMEVPIDDTGSTSNRDIKFAHFIKQDKNETQPDNDDNFLQVEVDVDETGLIIYLRKEVNGASTVLDSGYDYTMDGTRSTGDLEATIWRMVFNDKPGTSSATLSVYVKQEATLALAESATENELDGSPYDVSDLAFNIGYSSYRIYTENATYFGGTFSSANRAASTYLRLDYEDAPFDVDYDFTLTDYGEGDVTLWDGDPDSGGIRVYDEDHEFANDPYMQNELIRLHIDPLTQYGLEVFYWTGATWSEPRDRLQFLNALTVTDLQYPSLLRIVYLSPEKIVLQVKLHDTAASDDNEFLISNIELNRGNYYLVFDLVDIYPFSFYQIRWSNSSDYRFGYAGDDEISDDDLVIAANNSTLTDNFMMGFDNDKTGIIQFIAFNKKPSLGSARFVVSADNVFITEQMDASIIVDTEMYVGLTPFSLIANLYIDAKDATLIGGAGTVVDANAASGTAVQLNAAGESVGYDITAGTDLPAGYYLAVVRALRVAVEDMVISVQNTTDGEYRNEEGADVTETLTASYAYYSIFFHISDADVTGTDNIRVLAEKADADADEIRIDYFLIVPIGNGMDWPQDQGHSALRSIDQLRKLCER